MKLSSARSGASWRPSSPFCCGWVWALAAAGLGFYKKGIGTQEAQQSLSHRERDAAKRQGEGSNDETFRQRALTRPSATLSRWERDLGGKNFRKKNKKYASCA